MKKILLLLVSGLLIACMAGSAMAAPCEIDILKSPYVISSGEDSGTVEVYEYLEAGYRTITVKTSSDAIQAQIVGMGDDNWASGSNKKSMTYTVTGEKDPTLGYLVYPGTSDMVKTQFTLKVRQTPGSKLTSGSVTVYDNDGEVFNVDANDQASASVATNIPEFPTVALPVAGILGLLFVFGRKKEEM